LYNLIQENEIPLFLAVVPGAVTAVLDKESLWQGVGRPPARLYDILISLLVKEYFDLSLRRSIGFLKILNQAKLINIKVHCFKTLDNYLNKRAIQRYLQRLIELTSDLFAQVENCMATDATGITTSCYSSWYSIRVCKKSRKMDHIMVHISIGTRSNVVVAIDVNNKPGRDNKIFRSHVKKVSKRFDVAEWSGDSMYLARENCDAVSKIGAEPWFNLKKNTTPKALGSPAWKKMVNTTREQPELAKRKYHKRSNVESTNAAKKRKFGNFVRCRLPTAKRNEELLSWVGYNFSIVPRAVYEFKQKPSWAPTKTFYT